MKKILLLLVASFIFSACNAKTTTPNSQSSSKSDSTYTYRPDGDAAKAGVPSFNLTPPSGWTSQGVSGSQLAHFESMETDTEVVEGGEVTTNAVIIVRATGGYASLDEFAREYKASGKNVKGYQQIGSSADRLEFKYKTKVGNAEITIHELDYLFFKDGISFLVKGYASDAAWGKHASEIQSALNSFRFQ